MKKLLVLAITALTITGLVGCGGNDSKVEGNKNNSQIEQQSGNKESKKDEVVIAKVTKIIGNQISVNLSNSTIDDLPEVNGVKPISKVELDESQKKAIENGETIQLADGSIIGAATVDPNLNSDEDPAISDEEVQKQIEEGTATYGDGDKNVNLLEGISFDAGSKDLTISAGVKISNPATVKEGKLSDIKEGSVLSIIIDKNTNTVTEIIILG